MSIKTYIMLKPFIGRDRFSEPGSMWYRKRWTGSAPAYGTAGRNSKSRVYDTELWPARTRNLPTSLNTSDGLILACTRYQRRETMADKDNVAEGKAEQAKGKVQEVVGKVTGDEELEAHGEGTQTGGEAQEGIGHLQDAAKDVLGKE